MTTETGCRIDPTIDPVTTQVVAAMGHATGRVSLILERRFQFDVGGMTVIAEAGLMAQRTDLFTLVRGLPVVVHPERSVDKSLIRDIAVLLWVMTIGASPRLFTQICR